MSGDQQCIDKNTDCECANTDYHINDDETECVGEYIKLKNCI